VAGLIRHPLLKMLYVFVGTLGHTFLGMYLLLNRLPVYKVFELAPRVYDIDARMDQGFAGALMILIGTPLLFITEIVLFAQWFREHNAPAPKSNSSTPVS
jgi:cytochrome c oxidase assembly factor CtaG